MINKKIKPQNLFEHFLANGVLNACGVLSMSA